MSLTIHGNYVVNFVYFHAESVLMDVYVVCAFVFVCVRVQA